MLSPLPSIIDNKVFVWHVTDVYLLATASDFYSGESWGYRKFYELSKLVRAWEQLIGAIVSHGNSFLEQERIRTGG